MTDREYKAFIWMMVTTFLGVTLFCFACSPSSPNPEGPTACERQLTVCKLDLAACQHDAESK